MTRVGLLECDHVDEGLRSVDGDYRDMFTHLMAPHRLELVPVDARNGELPETASDFDAYLITGSRASVYDDEPWIDDLSAFVRDVADAGAPLVGICFGHQLLAHALGGEVRKAETGWGVGPHEVTIEAPEPWMEPGPLRPRLQYMHQDQVVRLPEGGQVIGASDHCPVAMLRVGDRLLGMQAHPEFSTAFVEALLDARVDRIEADRVAAARRDLGTPTDADALAVASWMAAWLRR